MITPLEHKRYYSPNSLEFATYSGTNEPWFHLTDYEHNGDNWISDQSGSSDYLYLGSIGSDPLYFTEDDGSFSEICYKVLGHPNRRFLP